jgi:two-component sensor histidine kinase
MELDVDTLVPLGLIVNELITNSLKYAFPDEKGGFLKVSLQEIKNQLVLNIMDNGVGFDPQNIRDNSFGQNLVKSLVNQLDGEMILLNNGGTNIEIILKEFSGSK